MKIPVILFIGIFIMSYGYAQKIKVLDSVTETIIPYVTFKIDDNKNMLSDINGIIELNNIKAGQHKSISVSHLGYIPISFNLPRKDTVIFLTENIIRLGEIIISNTEKTSKIIGNFQKKTNNVIVNSKVDRDINFTVVNKSKPINGKIKALLFYVFKDKNYANLNELSPLEIVFYKSNAIGLPTEEPLYRLSVNNYAIGWNKVSLDEFETPEGNNFFYGIKWVYHPLKYHYKNITKKKIYPFFGSKLGTVSTDNAEFHQTYFFNIDKGWKATSSSPAMLALEVII